MKFKKYFIVFLSVIIIVVTSVVSVSAATTTGSVKTLSFEEVKTKFNIKYDETKYPYYYFAKQVDNSRYIVFVSSSPKCFTVDNISSLRFSSRNNNSGIYFLCYVSSDLLQSFVPSNDDRLLSFGDNSTDFVMLSSNSDLLFHDGTVFFQRPTPLLDRLLSLVPGVGEKITGDLGILTTCGIGCLALLIGLSLLPKVLYKFL
mgnify:CR=1 FL=1